jgi:hypothetical protein
VKEADEPLLQSSSGTARNAAVGRPVQRRRTALENTRAGPSRASKNASRALTKAVQDAGPARVRESQAATRLHRATVPATEIRSCKFENREFKPTNANEQPKNEATIAPLLHSIRGLRVILDIDLARLYGVETRALNQAVKRNRKKFPPDFMVELKREEIAGISQTVTSLGKLRFSKQVHAFAEHGALMAATILNSPRAVAMSVYIIRAFVKLREDQAANAAVLKRRTSVGSGGLRAVWPASWRARLGAVAWTVFVQPNVRR